MQLGRVIPPPPAVVSTTFGVTLTDEERTGLTKVVRTGRGPARRRTDARVLLKADAAARGPRWTDEQIAAAFDGGLRRSARIRRVFGDHGLPAALPGQPRPRRPRELDGRAEAPLIALAGSIPPDGPDRWTLQLLTDRFVALEVSSPVSDETVRRVVQQTRSSRG